MMTRRLRAAFAPSPRIRPLLDGEVPLGGYDVDFTSGLPSRLHKWHLDANACDFFEFSLSNFLICHDNPKRSHLHWTALPVFPGKAKLFLSLHVREDAGIEDFSDLRNKRVGVPDFQMTAAVCLRMVLRELYGVESRDIQWVNGRTRRETREVAGTQLADGIRIRRLLEGESLQELLRRGEVDAAFGDTHSVPVEEEPGIRVLPAEVGRQLFADFHACTGVTPINHVLVVQQELIDEDPTFPQTLYEAFETSKGIAYERARDAEALLVFPEIDYARNTAEFGQDPFASGMAVNRRMIQLASQQLLDDALIRTPVDVEAVFASSLLGT